MLRVNEFQQIVFVKFFFADGIDNQPATGSQRLQSVYYRFPGRDGVDDAVESFQNQIGRAIFANRAGLY